ncbi:hypothetical protein [Levilactobacillus suantsaii]|nr:hypothetical protein [Levilactobacillus suantsaii]
MLTHDISSRMKQEKRYVKVPARENETGGKALNITISVAIAIIVLAGILYPLVSLF